MSARHRQQPPQPGALVVVSPAELVQLIREGVRAELDARAGDREPEWLDQTQAAAVLGVARSSIPTLCRRDGLPHTRLGRLYRFRREDLHRWLATRGGPHTLRAIKGGG